MVRELDLNLAQLLARPVELVDHRAARIDGPDMPVRVDSAAVDLEAKKPRRAAVHTMDQRFLDGDGRRRAVARRGK